MCVSFCTGHLKGNKKGKSSKCFLCWVAFNQLDCPDRNSDGMAVLVLGVDVDQTIQAGLATSDQSHWLMKWPSLYLVFLSSCV